MCNRCSYSCPWFTALPHSHGKRLKASSAPFVSQLQTPEKQIPVARRLFTAGEPTTLSNSPEAANQEEEREITSSTSTTTSTCDTVPNEQSRVKLADADILATRLNTDDNNSAR